jgi:hypothetical protein
MLLGYVTRNSGLGVLLLLSNALHDTGSRQSVMDIESQLKSRSIRACDPLRVWSSGSSTSNLAVKERDAEMEAPGSRASIMKRSANAGQAGRMPIDVRTVNTDKPHRDQFVM